MHNMRDLLFIVGQTEIDRESLAHSTGVLQSDIDQLLDNITLRMLSELPVARRHSVESAGDFDSACHDLMEVIEAGDDIEVIRDTYLYMHDEWERLDIALRGIGNQRARQALRDVRRSLHSLQAELGIQFDFNREQAMELASTLLNGSRQMQYDIRGVLRPTESLSTRLSEQQSAGRRAVSGRRTSALRSDRQRREA